jgi:hypothetical protein
MQDYNLRNDNGRDVKFTGECIGSAANEFDRAHGSRWSGETGRRYEYDLYRTKSGKFVCVKTMFTMWQGERDHHAVEVCATLGEVFAYFGTSRLAKELYEDAGLDDAEEVA